MPTTIFTTPDIGPHPTGTPVTGRADSAWAALTSTTATLTSTTATLTATAITAALLGALTTWLITRRPARNDFSKHLMYVPLLLVNAAAVYGQVAFFYDQVAPDTWPIPGKLALSVLIAAAIESIAVYVGWHAHDALLNKASATAARLRRASYALALIVGAINYAHFAGATFFDPTAASVAFGLLSMLSPWLWGLHTRRAQHVQLTNEGAVDATGATFSGERIRSFPFRSYMARRWSIDHYVTDPREAWEGYNAHLARQRTEKPSTRIRAAWLVLAGHADVDPAVVSGQSAPIRVQASTGHPADIRPATAADTPPAIGADTATGHAPDTRPDIAPDMHPTPAPDTVRTPTPDTRTGTGGGTAPDTAGDTPIALAADTRPDTRTPATPTQRRTPRRTLHRTPKWTKEQLKAFKLRDNDPDISYPLIAREVGVSEKTVSRWFKARDAAGTDTAPDMTPDTVPTFPLPKPPVTQGVNGYSHTTEENWP